MHADLSFSYLRFAEAASFDKKELRRSFTSQEKVSNTTVLYIDCFCFLLFYDYFFKVG